MQQINQVYINGVFSEPHGEEIMELIHPVTGKPASRVRLADEVDAQRAIAAAKAAYPAFSRSSREQRMEWLQRLHEAVAAAEEQLVDVMVEEYGGPLATCRATARRAAAYFASAREVLRHYQFEQPAGNGIVRMVPLGVIGIITPWNANYGFICGKLSMALAAGSTAVIKPSELSAAQTALLAQVLHTAELPPGVINIVTGRGDRVGAEMTRHPDIAKISFTGSTAVGKSIMRGAAETMKRVTLELGGKSPTILLDDADFARAMPIVASIATMNSGQACIAGTRLLVPERRLAEAEEAVVQAMRALKTGRPRDEGVKIGPMVTQRQWERVQGYIRKGVEEGARLLLGGEGKPEGLEDGHFVKTTVFGGVRNDMTIAREEIFGPVLSVIAYRDEEEAIRIANDTPYGLHGYVFGGDLARANRVAGQIMAGRVFINGMYDEPNAPFGGFKQSGQGRQFGVWGLEDCLEPQTFVGHAQTL